MFSRRGVRVHLGVHPDDHMALFQSQGEQGLQAVRPDAEIAAGRHQRLPQLDRLRARMVQLEAGLAREREADHVAGDAGHVGVHVLQEPRGVDKADAAQQLARQWAGDVDGAECQGAVEDVHVEAPRFDPIADPGFGERCAA